jgi:ABC-type nitrate/sulfonate/bicarbonate transport system substrate-binding protein
MNRKILIPAVGTLAVLVAVLTTASAATHSDWTSLSIALAPPSANRVVFLVAEDEGVFEKNGLDVELYVPANAAASARRDGLEIPSHAIQDRSPATDHIATGLGTNLALVASDVTMPTDMVYLLTFDNVTRGHIVVRDGIDSAEDLKGMRLGYTGGSRTHFVALVFAEHMGWDPRYDISLMANARMDALRAGRIDAIVANEARLAQAREDGFESVFDVSTLNVPTAGTGVAARRGWLEENRDIASAFIKSIIEANALLKQDKSVAMKAIKHWYGVTDPAKQDLLYAGAIDTPEKPYPSLEGIKKIMQIFDSNEMRKYKAEDFYDDSFVRELDESGYIDSLY